MNRIFGKKKVAGPAPSLDDAAKGIGGRVDAMETKIESLDKELRLYKDKIKKHPVWRPKSSCKSVP